MRSIQDILRDGCGYAGKGAHFTLRHISRKETASSGGRSLMINPLAPESLACWIACASPYARMGL
jgi:hypothetical protein